MMITGEYENQPCGSSKDIQLFAAHGISFGSEGPNGCTGNYLGADGRHYDPSKPIVGTGQSYWWHVSAGRPLAMSDSPLQAGTLQSLGPARWTADISCVSYTVPFAFAVGPKVLTAVLGQDHQWL